MRFQCAKINFLAVRFFCSQVARTVACVRLETAKNSDRQTDLRSTGRTKLFAPVPHAHSTSPIYHLSISSRTPRNLIHVDAVLS